MKGGCWSERRGGRRGRGWDERKSIRVGQGTGKTLVGRSQLEGMDVLPVVAHLSTAFINLIKCIKITKLK